MRRRESEEEEGERRRGNDGFEEGAENERRETGRREEGGSEMRNRRTEDEESEGKRGSGEREGELDSKRWSIRGTRGKGGRKMHLKDSTFRDHSTKMRRWEMVKRFIDILAALLVLKASGAMCKDEGYRDAPSLFGSS